MALGKEKFAISVAERCQGSPVWREEATFELPPPPRRSLAGDGGGKSGHPAVLQLTVSHRALMGLDKFLGRAEISLSDMQDEGGRRTTRRGSGEGCPAKARLGFLGGGWSGRRKGGDFGPCRVPLGDATCQDCR